MAAMEFRTVGVYETSFAANQARNMLETSGIPAFLENEHSTSALSYMTPGMGGIKLLVSPANADAARRLIAKFGQDDDAAQLTEWQCAHCAAEVDAGFDLCWQCGRERTDETIS